MSKCLVIVICRFAGNASRVWQEFLARSKTVRNGFMERKGQLKWYIDESSRNGRQNDIGEKGQRLSKELLVSLDLVKRLYRIPKAACLRAYMILYEIRLDD